MKPDVELRASRRESTTVGQARNPAGAASTRAAFPATVPLVLMRHRGVEPGIYASAYVAPTAVLMGRVTVGPSARILSGAALSAEGSRIEIGESSIISEHAVLRATAVGDAERPVLVGDRVLVGPHATLLGCTVGPSTFIATGATVVHGARIGAEAIVAVGAFVHAGSVLPDGFFLAPNLIAIGDPVTVYAPDDPTLPEAIRSIGFARYAFGLEAPQRRQIAEVRSAEYSAHLQDEIVER